MTSDVDLESLPLIATEAPVLQVRNARVHFGGVKAVDDISLELRSGLIYGIIGPNGSGKSTLLGAITRLTKLTSGELLMQGKEYQQEPPSVLARNRVARTFQTVRLLPERNVRDNVRLGADARIEDSKSTFRQRFFKSQDDESIDRAIERSHLKEFEEYFPPELSYGTQRRVEIARALASDPQLLLMDEPTAGMNQAEREETSSLLMQLRGDGLTQLLVEHDVQMMVDTCDYIFAMNFGQLIAQGKPEEVVRDPQVQEAYLGRRAE